jgi:uridylate kinase
MASKYKRILLKLSGESLMGSLDFGLDPVALRSFAEEIVEASKLGCEIGLVIGGGNIFRGIQSSVTGIHKVSGDYMGMLATVINSVAFQNTLEELGAETRLQSAIKMEQIAEPYIRRKAIRHLEKGRIVLFGAGTGNPYFTTDTAAVLRAIEIESDIVIKGTRVDGVYDSDPETNPDAKFYNEISFKEVIQKDIRVMDHTAFTLCAENKLPLRVINFNERGNLIKLLNGESIGTLINF